MNMLIRSNHNPAAFSLIELLVVIFIISLLTAISAGVLTRATRSGDRLRCLSNQRQLFYAWSMYASSNNNRLMSPDTQFNIHPGQNNWVCDGPVPFLQPEPDLNTVAETEASIAGGNGLVIYLGVQVDANTRCGAIWPYIKSFKVFGCPSDRVNPIRGYSMSVSMNSENSPYTRIEHIATPSAKLVFIDAVPQPLLCSDIPKIHYFWPDGPFTRHYNQLSSRHENGTNAVFADGHAAYRRWKDARTATFTLNPTEMPPNAGNQDFDWLDAALKTEPK
jgi:prepilin-type N-terminal cleavage/methylation domain-containing protein/prepilin-type processing-associated H-X9-DG protein